MSIKYDFLLPQNRPSGIGNNMYLLGTSEDGPYMEPMYIKSKEQMRKIYGTENKGTLVKAFDEAYDRNKDVSIYAMRITGSSARLEVKGVDRHTGDYVTIMTLYTAHAGEKYNGCSLTLTYDYISELNALLLTTPHGRVSYLMKEDMTVGGIVEAINRDCRSDKHKVMAATEYPYTRFTEIADEFASTLHLTGGEDGLFETRDDMYLASDMAYNILLGRPVDIVVPVGMYVDDVHPAYMYGDSMYGSAFYSSNRDYLQLVDTYNNNKVVSYHEQLIDFCREQLKLGYMTHGVIGFRPLDVVPHNISHDNSYIKRLVEATAFRDRHGFLEHINGAWLDKGMYISVVSAELVFRKGTQTEYVASAASRYAATIAGHYDTTTNIPIGNDVELRYELSEPTRAELAKLGVVTFRDSIRHGLVVHSGVTPALPQTDYHSFANVRMVQITLAYMNSAAELVYESEFDAGMRRTYLEELVQERLSLLKEWKVIKSYDYQIRFLNDDSVGEILLTLQTKYTVEGIQTSAEIRSTEV